MKLPYSNTNRNASEIFKINREVLGLKDVNDNPRKIIFSKKELKDLEVVKRLAKYYEYLGFQQVNDKWEKLSKLYELAYGRIDHKEVQVAKDTYKQVVSVLTDEDWMRKVADAETIEEVDLKFFPLIPPVVNSIINDLDKKVTRMYVRAVNPEAVNTVIEERNKELQALLVEQATRLFETTLDNLDQEARDAQMKIFQESSKIQEIYQKDFRLEVELWANHHLNIEEQKYDLKSIERTLMEKLLVTDFPFLKVEFLGNDYKYSLVDERNCFFLKGPLDEDASEYMMFGTFTYNTLDTIIGKYKIDEDVAAQLDEWSSIMTGQIYIPNRPGDPNQDYLEVTTENVRWHKQLHGASRIGDQPMFLDNYDESSEIPPNLVRETVIHFKLPRKKGELTYIVNGVRYTDIVDESYKVYVEPEYDLTYTKKRTADNLIHGEHIDWFYETESWTAVKLDIASRQVTNMYSDYNSIWVKIEKDPIQIKNPFKRFSTILPVHGGKTSQMTESLSLVEKGMPWQSMFNFLGNKCQSLMATEIGLFFIMNQAMIPTESLDGSWDKDSLLKFGQLAHDFGITVTGMDVNSFTGQNQLLMGQGYGQQVDLTKTNDIMAKLTLMMAIKKEFYATLGLSPEQMGEISPYQSGKSVAQGLQRTSNMIHHYYRRVKDIMKRARQTGLYYAKYFQEYNPKDLTYTNNEGARIVFRTEGKDFSLADLAIYLQNDLEDIDRLNDLYQLVMNDNTMGSDAYEKASILFARTSSEVLDQLKKLKLEREQELKKQQEFEMQKQQELLRAQQEQLIEEQEREDRRLEMKLQYDKEIAELKAYGYANSEVSEIYDAIQKAKEEQDSQMEYDLKLRDILRKENESKQKLDLQREANDKSLVSQESLELMRLKQRDKELQAQNERTRVMAKIALEKEKSKPRNQPKNQPKD